jgi:hypothetical protein
MRFKPLPTPAAHTPPDELPLQVEGDLGLAIERSLPALAALLLSLSKTTDETRHGAAPVDGVKQNRRSVETSPPAPARSAANDDSRLRD